MDDKVKLPEWRSHKVVEAAKVLAVKYNPGTDETTLMLSPEVYIPVSTEYEMRHKPQAGGYYVKYPDGYESWSPAEAFEEGYTPLSDDEQPTSPSLADELDMTTDPMPEKEGVMSWETNGDVLAAAARRLRDMGGFINNRLATLLAEIVGEHACFAKAGLDEPLFTLRAKDRLSPKLVRTWAKRAKKRGALRTKVRGARLVAKDMKNFEGRRYPT